MNTQLLNPDKDEKAYEKAAKYILAGEVVGMPTETVYGLAANALDGQAVKKIFIAKGRPQDNPLIVHIADLKQMDNLVSFIPENAKKLADTFWPGPLTIILPKAECIPIEVSAGLDTVGIRFPNHKVAQNLIKAAGVPLAAPSANLSGRPSTTTAQHVMEDLNGKIPAVLEGGACTVGVESTVISLAGDKPRLLRPGGISLEQLMEVIGEVEVDRAIKEKIGDDVRVSAPGMKYRHYAPKAPVTVVCGDANKTAEYIKQNANKTEGILCFKEYMNMFSDYKCFEMGFKDDVSSQAKRIFDALRAFDETDVTEIWTQCPSDEGLGLAVANRLKKAAGFHVIDLG